MNIKNLSLFLLLVVFTACDCLVTVSGTVLSSGTGKPIVGAQIVMIKQGQLVNSNEDGTFIISKVTGFCFDPEIEISKDGFKSFNITLKSEPNFQSFIVKSDLESVDFREPVYPDSTNRQSFIVSTWVNKYSQNFENRDGHIIIYLDEINMEKEVNSIKEKLLKGSL